MILSLRQTFFEVSSIANRAAYSNAQLSKAVAFLNTNISRLFCAGQRVNSWSCPCQQKLKAKIPNDVVCTVCRATCSTDDDCAEGDYLKFGHGPMTGSCVASDVDRDIK